MTSWPEGYGCIEVACVGSTLDAAMDEAAGTPAPFWYMARRQTAARGRRGRAWAMAKGNFAATLVLRTEDAPGVVALRSFVMSLALCEALEEICNCTPVFSLKWPNDVLLSGGKVAGILLERGQRGGDPGLLALGVGVNLAAAPMPDAVEPGALRPVSVSQVLSVNAAPRDLLVALARHYADREAQFRASGFAPIRAEWLARAARLGEEITARTGSDSYTGIFEDVDHQGQLVLRGPRGIRKIAAADIYF